MTDDELKYIAPLSSKTDREAYLKELNNLCPKYGIVGIELAAFVAQTAHESGGFHYLKEIASGAAYEGRRDLGNVNKGDGVRFKGRGYIQITGRANYTKFREWLGGAPDIVSHPEMIERPHLAMLASIWYWKHNNLSPIALSDDFRLLTRKINGGMNGYTSRLAYYIKAKKILNIE